MPRTQGIYIITSTVTAETMERNSFYASKR